MIREGIIMVIGLIAALIIALILVLAINWKQDRIDRESAPERRRALQRAAEDRHRMEYRRGPRIM